MRLEDAYCDFFWPDSACTHVLLDDGSIFAVFAFQFGPQDVSNADVGELECLGQQSALRAFARTRPSEYPDYCEGFWFRMGLHLSIHDGVV